MMWAPPSEFQELQAKVELLRADLEAIRARLQDAAEEREACIAICAESRDGLEPNDRAPIMAELIQSRIERRSLVAKMGRVASEEGYK